MRSKKKDDVIGIGSVVITEGRQRGETRLSAEGPEYIGEVSGIVQGRKNWYELILYDKRLKPIIRGDSSYRRKRVPVGKCKLLDESFKIRFRANVIELGDIICRCFAQNTLALSQKYGVVVGFTHPDGLLTTSYSNGYNGTDLIDCVEIEKRGLRRKRDAEGNLKRFSTTSERVSSCEVDLWSKSGPKIISK